MCPDSNKLKLVNQLDSIQGINEEIDFFINGGNTCNQAKTACNQIELSRCQPLELSKLVFHDLVELYFERLYILMIVDLYVGLMKLICIFAANAIALRGTLIWKWACDRGSPLQLQSEIETNKFNDIVLLLYKISGIG